MPISTFELNNKYGLINASGIRLTKPIYQSIEIFEELIIGYQYRDEEPLISYIDFNGDVLVELDKYQSEILCKNITGAYPLDHDLVMINYINQHSLELCGVTNRNGELVLQPMFSEISLLANGYIKTFNLASESNSSNKDYGIRVYRRDGSLLVDSELIEYGYDDIFTLKFKNGLIHYTDLEGELIFQQ